MSVGAHVLAVCCCHAVSRIAPLVTIWSIPLAAALVTVLQILVMNSQLDLTDILQMALLQEPLPQYTLLLGTAVACSGSGPFT